MKTIELQLSDGTVQIGKVAAEYTVNDIGYTALAIKGNNKNKLVFYRMENKDTSILYEIEDADELKQAQNGLLRVIRYLQRKGETQ